MNTKIKIWNKNQFLFLKFVLPNICFEWNVSPSRLLGLFLWPWPNVLEIQFNNQWKYYASIFLKLYRWNLYSSSIEGLLKCWNRLFHVMNGANNVRFFVCSKSSCGLNYWMKSFNFIISIPLASKAYVSFMSLMNFMMYVNQLLSTN
jgi:hypothetical protein